MREMKGFTELRERGRMTWSEQSRAWVATPDEITDTLASEGFAECKHVMTTSRRDGRSAGGLWQGVDARTGSVASAIWVHRPLWHHAIMFIEIDGESLTESQGAAGAIRATPVGDPYQDEGGEA